MPKTGFLGWAYISGSTVSFDSGVADKQVLFMSGTSVVSGTDNFQYDYNTDTLTVTGNMTISGTLRADTFIHREVENITSTGSTLFGDSTDDRHIRTGSLEVSSSAGVLYYNQSLAINVPFTGTNIVPFADDTYDIGADGNIFRYIYANELVGNVDGAINFTAKNDEGDSITRGQAVYIKGVSGNTPTVALAACDDPAKMPAFGLAASDAAQGANLQIISFGNIKNLNLSSIYDGLTFSLGDVLYIATGSGGTSGSLTNVPPTGSNNLLQNMAKVVRNGGGGDGQLRVGGAGRTNATPNLDAGYIFVGNSTDQSVQDNTIYVDIASSKVGINNTSPSYSLDVTGASGINLFDSGNNNKLTIDSNGIQHTGSKLAYTSGEDFFGLSSASFEITNTDPALGLPGANATIQVYDFDSSQSSVLNLTPYGSSIGCQNNSFGINASSVSLTAEFAASLTSTGSFGYVELSSSADDIRAYGNINTVGNITASGHVSASTFYGDGSNLSGIGGGSPGGLDMQLQFNSGSTFSGSSNFVFDYTNNRVGIANPNPNYTLDVIASEGVNFYNDTGGNTLTVDPNGLTYFGVGGGILLGTLGNTQIQSNTGIFLSGTVENAAPFGGSAAYVLKNDVGYLNTDNSNAGDVLIVGSSADASVAIGNVVYLDNTGTWYQASAAATGSGDSQLIGISLSAAPQTDGILTRGIYQIATSLLSSSTGTGSLDKGSQVYISPSTAGGYTTVRPTSAGEIVRVVGHSVDTNKIFFNPSPDFVEI